jgi:transposase-like protein
MNSLKKYGLDAHKLEIIEECDVKQLDERETYWKQHYVDFYGWKMMLFCNLHDSGGGPKSEATKNKIKEAKTGKPYKLDKLPKLDIINDYLSNGESTNRLAKKYNITPGLIRKFLINEGVYVKNKNKQTKNQTSEQIQKAINNFKKYNSKPILQYDLEDNFIKEWESVTQASKELKIDQSGISNVLLKKKKQVKNFIFTYKL